MHIRPLVDGDCDQLLALHMGVSDRSNYLRFFTWGRASASAYVNSVVRLRAPEGMALVAVDDGRIVGTAACAAVAPAEAEVAVLVHDDWQHLGIGTLLLEHLAARARTLGFQRFRALTLPENGDMLRVFSDLGLPCRLAHTDDGVQVECDLTPHPDTLAVLDRRDAESARRSIRPLLAPRSVVVVGVSRRENSVGHQVLRAVVEGGFTGRVVGVGRHAGEVAGSPVVTRVADVGFAPDLALVAVPAPGVPAVVEELGRAGTGAVAVLTSGFGEQDGDGHTLQQETLAAARRHGMRLLGPNCLGLLNTDQEVRLDATFARLHPRPGPLALASQSGALGIAVVEAASARGLGVGAFVSLGNKADVSGNDVLQYWESDDHVGVIALYLESFGNPRKLARVGRRVTRSKPVLALKAGSSQAGRRGGLSHTAAAASPETVTDAVLREAGILRMSTVQDLIDTAAVLATGRLPKGPRVAVVGNAGGPAILAADAAAAAGLEVPPLSAATQSALRQVAPAAAAVANPVDLGASTAPEVLETVLRRLLESGEADAVLAVVADTRVSAGSELAAAVDRAAEAGSTPVALTLLGAPGSSPGPVPRFAFPEPAVRALAAARQYAVLRARAVPAPRTAPFDPGPVRSVLERLQNTERGCGWLAGDDAADLLAAAGFQLPPQQVVDHAGAAVAAARALGGPVAVKLAQAGTVHKSEHGGVRLGLTRAADVRAAFKTVTAGTPGSKVLVQRMADPGIELIVGGLQDPQVGPLVMVGAGGTASDLLADRQYRLGPVTMPEAREMVAALRTAPLLDGYRGGPHVDVDDVAAVVVRLGNLLEAAPEVAEVDLNPVVCSGHGVALIDVKVRLGEPVMLPDATVRRLR